MSVVLTHTLAGYMNGAPDLTFLIGVVTCCQPQLLWLPWQLMGAVIPGSRWYGAVCNEAAMYSSEVILACHRRFQVHV